MNSTCEEYEPVAGCCENGYGFLESIKCGNFPDQPHDRGMTLRQGVRYFGLQVQFTGNITQCRKNGFK
jgi:hypothetical protein